MEVYRDNLTVYGGSFNEEQENLKKVLIIWKGMNAPLSHEKCFMMFNKGIVLGHHILGDGIKVNSSNAKVISKLSMPSF